MAVGLRLYTDGAVDGAERPSIDVNGGEEILHIQGGVTLVLGNRRPAPEHCGTLFITSQQVIWLSDEDRRKGYAVDFLSISLHAVSRDPDAYPSPCIYAQIETETEDDDGDESDDAELESDTEPQDLSKIKEMRFVPSDPNQLDRMFEVFCECAELNPEPMEEEQEEPHEWIFSADQLPAEGIDVDSFAWTFSNDTARIGSATGDHELSLNVLQLQINDQCFEDAEEMEHNHPNDTRQ